jgi:DNA polymerase III epsilon subunit-like protein
MIIPEHLIIVGLDTETTGFVQPDHRIVEVYNGLWRGGKKIFE